MKKKKKRMETETAEGEDVDEAAAAAQRKQEKKKKKAGAEALAEAEAVHETDISERKQEKKKRKREAQAIAEAEMAQEAEMAEEAEVAAAAQRKLERKKRKAEAAAQEAEAAEVAAATQRKLEKKKRKAEAQEAEVPEEAEVALPAQRKLEKKKRKAEFQPEAEAEVEDKANELDATAAGKKKEKKKKKADAQASAETEVSVPTEKKQEIKSKVALPSRIDFESEDDAVEGEVSVSQAAKAALRRGEGLQSNGPSVVQEATTPVFTAFVGGLPSHVDEDQLKTDFAECGEVASVILTRWPEDNSSKGVAFITFATEGGLNAALQYNGQTYEGKMIRVEKKAGNPKPSINMGLGGQRGFKPPGCKSVAVLDMSKETTEDDLWNFFEQCGTVTAVKILKHRETYESRGIAFVDFADTGDTDNAVKLVGKTISGKSVRIEYAAPKNDRSSNSGRNASFKGHGGPDVKPEGCMSVVVGNLPEGAEEKDVWRLINKTCTSASNVSCIYDRNTGKSKGIAFVDFDDTNDTDVAVKLSGKEVLGRAVTVRYKK